MKIIRKQLSQTDLLPPGTRYDEPTDTVQTWDGTSWIDTPERDPRNNDSFPPPATADPQCDGAARMSAFLQDIVSGIISGVDAGKSDAELALVVLGVLVFIPFIDLLYILIASLVGALIIVGSTWLHDAFDTFVWDDLTCLIYCRLNENGFITDTQLEGLRADISAEFGVDPASVLLDILIFVGRGGLNDAAAIRSETGDCSGCTDCLVCNVVIPATSPWTTNGYDTGIDVLNGVDVTVNATGLWTTGGGNPSVSADGMSVDAPDCVQYWMCYTGGTAKQMQLMYRVGISGEWSIGGSNFSFTPAADGRLYMCANDAAVGYGNNSGSISARVEGGTC
jgi:hypothetical protein